MAKKTQTFEAQLDALKSITQSLESGKLSLDEALSQFEKGIGLYRSCETMLQEAERKVSILMANNEEQPWQETEEV